MVPWACDDPRWSASGGLDQQLGLERREGLRQDGSLVLETGPYPIGEVGVPATEATGCGEDRLDGREGRVRGLRSGGRAFHVLDLDLQAVALWARRLRASGSTLLIMDDCPYS